MKPEFSADFFTQNRERLRTLFTGTAPIVLTANGLLQRNGDTTFAFRQDSSFWYLTGIDEPDIVLVMDKGKDYLIVPGREASREAFDGSISHEDLTKISGITEIYDEKSGWKKLESRLKKAQHAATLAAAPAYLDRHGFYTNPARARLLEHIKESGNEIELLDLRPHLTRMRAIKQPEELAVIQAAIDMTVDAFKKVHRARQKYETENQIDAVMTAEFMNRGAGHAYQPIIASGKNACTLHYIANNSPIEQKELLLLDVGAEVNHYAADITRTFAVTEPTKRQQEVTDAVLEVHALALSLLRPGAFMKEYEAKIEQFMGEKLRELGLIKLIEKEEVRKYYPHATSHFLGLDVHDVADYDRALEPGMVLTVEPGIYIPEESIGVRIEDNVLITPEGLEVLTQKLPTIL